MDFIQKTFFIWIIGISSAYILLSSIFATGKPESYYIEMDKSNSGFYCTYADVNWRVDPKIFCSDDISKTLMVMIGLNGQMQPKQSIKPPSNAS